MNFKFLRSASALALLLGMCFWTSPAQAESEPGDNNNSGASSLTFNSSKLASGSGNISAGDTDWYKITNSRKFSSLTFTFKYNPTASSFHSIELFDNSLNSIDQSFTDDATPNDTAVITFSTPASGASYFVAVRGTSGPSNTYTLKIQGTGGTTPKPAKVVVDNWTQYFQLAGSTYNSYASQGYFDYALAYYYYYVYVGYYVYYNAYCDPASAILNYWFAQAYFYFYATSSQGSVSTYYLYIYFSLGYYDYYNTLGNTSLAGYYYNFYLAYAYYYYFVGVADYSSANYFLNYYLSVGQSYL